MLEPIVVTGGTGALGRVVVDQLVAAGRQVRVISRHPAPAADRRHRVVADLLTGEGVAAALSDGGAIIHCATSGDGEKDVTATRTLVDAAQRAGCAHLLFVSIVGIDRVPLGYYQGKLAAERLVERCGVPHTILRATQFHARTFDAYRQGAHLAPDSAVGRTTFEEYLARQPNPASRSYRDSRR